MSEFCSGSWLVLRTKSRHEGVVDRALQLKQIVSYLPTQRLTRQRQGRKREVELPLFPGYVFVRPRDDQYEGMRYIRGSCGLILSSNSTPATIPEQDLEAVRVLVDRCSSVSVDDGLVEGQRVRVMDGPLAGVEGELVQIKQRHLLVLNVELINRSVRVEVDRDLIAAL